MFCDFRVAKVTKQDLTPSGVEVAEAAAFQLGLLADDDLVFQMLEDRNRTSHLYNASMAEDVFSRIPAYQALMAAAAQALAPQ